MHQWSALFVKDFKLSRSVFLMGLVMNILIAMLTLYLERTAGDSLLMFVPLAVAAVIHVAYVPIIVFISLKSEGNHLHIWLSNPQSASKLLLSKIVNGLLMIMISLILLFALSGLLVAAKFSFIEPYGTDIWRVGLFTFPHIIWFSIELGLGVMVLWALYQYLKRRIGRWSWTVVAGAAILAGGIDAWFETSKLYRFMADRGCLTYKFPTLISDPIHTYVGGYIYDFIIMIGLFILAAWLVDHKVEG
ncbi:hypothetical protein [Paenibacillus hexagrammi]|uniref:ABC transporter permease n=1 Tax=Paenibacillus hexagrammi TaxID=2908839 RepID=A0ABY3SLY9_9BACL|nr:hypothetical protein [Paenibacillus sp. YPD9-1]UJF34096.1 hypothetical protein L0M14_02330 [Paenibacillus sp. YPD9-1]